MKINTEYMSVMRRGKWVESQTYRKHNESAITVFFCLSMGGCLIITAIILALV